MKNCLIILIHFVFLASFGQRINLISTDDIPGIRVTRFDSFTGQNLNTYLGIRTHLCFEYGFKQLYVSEYSQQDDQVRLEVYIMEDAPSAFGIYSVSMSNCNVRNLYSTFSCKNTNQVSAAYGPLFINTLNLSKTRSGLGLCETIIKAVMAKNPQETWYLPPLFQLPGLGPYINSLKYTEGPDGVSMGTPVLSGILANLKFNCYSVTIMTPAYSGILARIVFPDPSSMNVFLINAGLNSSGSTTPAMAGNGAYRSCYAIDDYKIVYLECTSPDLKLLDLIPQQPNPFW
jgi:hypothetical protein